MQYYSSSGKSSKLQSQDGGQSKTVQKLTDEYGDAVCQYLKFLLFPEHVAPVRQPRMFPLPTHLWKDSGVQTITATNGNAYIIWVPKIQPASPALGYTTEAVVSGTAFADLTGETVIHDFILPPTGFDTQHTQVTAACLKISYTGDLDDTSGTIEVGIAIHDDSSLSAIPSIALTDIKKTYFYKKMPIIHGARCIYLPINDRMLESSGEQSIGHNYAYHIHLTNVPVGAGDIRIDWDYFFEGNPSFAVHNQYLPTPGKMMVDTGKRMLTQTANIAMQSGGVTSIHESGASQFMKSVIHGIDAAVQISGPLKSFIAAMLTLF